jgi:hypothetical protein
MAALAPARVSALAASANIGAEKHQLKAKMA